MHKKIGIFLTGGGAKGAFEIGFLKAIEDLNIKPDVICGSSSGAIIGAGATYMNSQEILDCWNKLTLENAFHINSKKVKNKEGIIKILLLWKELILSTYKQHECISMNEMRDILYSCLEEEKIRKSQIDFGITTTLLPNLQLKKIWKEDMEENQLLEYIISSFYLPIYKPEKIIDNHYYLDISVIQKYPFEMLKEKNCEEVYLVLVEGTGLLKAKMAIHRVFNSNTIVHIINIKNNYSLLDFSKEQSIKGYQEGYDTTIKVLSNKKNH